MSGDSGIPDVTVETVDETIEMGSGSGPGGPFKMPSKEELLAMLDSLGLSPEETEEMRRSIIDGVPASALPEWAQPPSPWTSQTLILILFFLVVLSIISFILYRVIKNEKDKEKKREEKKEQKMLRKRKYK